MQVDFHQIKLKWSFDYNFYLNGDKTDIIGNVQHENNPFSKIDKSILNRIQNKQLILIFRLADEGDINYNSIILLEMLLNKYKIPIESFIFLHDCYKLPDTDIQNFKINTHMFIKSYESISLYKHNLLNKEIIKNKKHKFHFPIRRFRPHRLLLLDKLYLKYPDFIEKNLVSYNINVEDNKNLFNQNISDKLKNFMLSTIAKFIDDAPADKVGGYDCEFKETYANSYFTIVTETYFFENYYYVSEKSFQPIAHMQPFIILGRPGTLEYLKQNGFKTFHPYVDESYDLELDDNKRIDMVFNEICRLNELSNTQWDEMIENISDILEHNQMHLLKMNGIRGMSENLSNYLRKFTKNTQKLV